MTFFAYQGTLLTPSVMGSVNYTDCGFQPKAVIFWSSGQTTTGDAAGNESGAFSTFGNVSGGGVNYRMANNVSSTSAAPAGGHVGNNTIGVYILFASGGGYIASANLTAYLATGFTLNWNNANPVVNTIIHYLALGGTDLLVGAGSMTARTSVGQASVSTLAFQPKLVIFTDTITSGVHTASFGAASGPTARWSMGGSAAAAISMASTAHGTRILDNTRCIHLLNTAGATTTMEAIDLVSMNANGFTLNWITATATAHSIGWLALGGDATFGCGTWIMPTTTSLGNIDVEAGLSIAPTAYMLFGNELTFSGTAQTAGWRFSIGGTDGTRAAAVSFENRSNQIPTQARRWSDGAGNSNVLNNRVAPTSVTTPGSSVMRASHTAFTPTGFTVNRLERNFGYGLYIPYLTFGPPPIFMPDTALAGPADRFA